LRRVASATEDLREATGEREKINSKDFHHSVSSQDRKEREKERKRKREWKKRKKKEAQTGLSPLKCGSPFGGRGFTN